MYLPLASKTYFIDFGILTINIFILPEGTFLHAFFNNNVSSKYFSEFEQLFEPSNFYDSYVPVYK